MIQKNQKIKQLARKMCDRNVDEQLTELFEIDNEVSFSQQTPDEIAIIMLKKMGLITNE